MATRILVTGATGLLGSHAVRALRAAGHDVVAPARSALDLLAPGAAERLAIDRPAVIVHAAAVLPLAATQEEAARANRRIDDAVVAACGALGARLIYLSGTSVYGDAPPPWSERTPPRPVGAYVQAKLAGEEAARAALGDRALSLRISAPYGPGQRARTVIQVFIEAALANRPLRHHGSGAREQVFTAAEDVAVAVVRAVERPEAAGVVNIAGARPISMKALAELVVRAIPGSRSEVVASGEPDPQEAYRAAVELGRARELLGWAPAMSLEEGVARLGRALAGRAA